MDFIQAYLTDIGRYKGGLTTEEEQTATPDQLVEGNLRLVILILRPRMGIDRDFNADLVSAGNEGLIVASKKFDSSRGTRFGTMARWWITSYALAFIRHANRTVYIPISQDHRPTTLRMETTIDGDMVNRRSAWASDFRSIGAIGGDDDHDPSRFFMDKAIDVDFSTNPETEYRETEIKAELWTYMDNLSDRERNIIDRFYLKNDTLREIARDEGVCPERIRQIKKRGFEKLQRIAKRGRSAIHYQACHRSVYAQGKGMFQGSCDRST